MFRWSGILLVFVGVSSAQRGSQQKQFQHYYIEGVIIDATSENSLIPVFKPFVSLVDSSGVVIYGTSTNKDGSFKIRLSKEAEEKVSLLKVEGTPFKTQVIPYVPDEDSLFYSMVKLELDSTLLDKKIQFIYTGNHYVDQRAGAVDSCDTVRRTK